MKKSIICNNKHDTEYFNSRILGGVLVSADIFKSPCVSESAVEVTISDHDLYEKISQYAFLNGEDLQSLFQDDEYAYMSCFIRNVKAFQSEFENEDSLKELFQHDKGSTDYYLISFPEIKRQTQKVKENYSDMMLQAEILFKHIDNDKLAKIVLENLDCNVLITGGKGLESKFLLEKNNFDVQYLFSKSNINNEIIKRIDFKGDFDSAELHIISSEDELENPIDEIIHYYFDLLSAKDYENQGDEIFFM